MIISLTTDFGVQSQGVGVLEGTILSIAPTIPVIHLAHGLPEFNITAAARTLEAAFYLPIGCHVCVCDPGVGTKRKAIVIQVKRGDFLIGPDNGVLIPASRILGGIKKIHQITNPQYMRQPISSIFHGRDIFAPAATHLTKGISIEDLGPKLSEKDLVSAPYEEATISEGKIQASIIWINKFGSLHLNILHQVWDEAKVKVGDLINMILPNGSKVKLPVVNTFGEVAVGEPLILKDDFGRIEVAKNQGRFVDDYNLKIGDEVVIALF